MVPKVRNPLTFGHTVSPISSPELTHLQLKDPSLFKQNVCYVNGEWVTAASGKTFEVHGKLPQNTSP